MSLPTIAEIKELKNNREKRKQILSSLKEAKVHSEDIRLHSEPCVSLPNNPAYSRFLNRVEGYLDSYKFRVFKKYHRFPMETTALVSDILGALSKVFEGKNAVRSYTYVSEASEKIFSQFLKDTSFFKKWRTESLRALGTGINSILVVDIPREPEGRFPSPYFYFLPIEAVHDLDLDKDGNIIWVQYYQDETHLVHISKAGWQVLKTTGKDGKIESIEFEAENPTENELCRFWWEPKMKQGDNLLKLSPFSEWISKLDWVETLSIGKNILTMTNSSPVTWSIEEDCDFEDKANGVRCEGGFLVKNNGEYLRGPNSEVNSGYRACPNCGDRRFVGVGSHIEIPPPSKEDGDFRAPYGVVGIDKDSLEETRKDLSERKSEILEGVTGGGSKPVIDDQAINIPQVKAFFEGWTGVLIKTKKSFESSEEWLLETMSSLMFGGDVLQASSNYGTVFYLQSEEEALAFYTAARNAQLPDYILDFLLNEYYETKFKGDKASLEKVRLLMHLEPLKHLTKTQALELKDKGLATNEDIRIKLDFASLVQRFERDNGPIQDFGVSMEENNFSQRVERIKSVMASYLPEVTTAINNQT